MVVYVTASVFFLVPPCVVYWGKGGRGLRTTSKVY